MRVCCSAMYNVSTVVGGPFLQLAGQLQKPNVRKAAVPGINCLLYK
jgi:hypothetical protein